MLIKQSLRPCQRTPPARKFNHSSTQPTDGGTEKPPAGVTYTEKLENYPTTKIQYVLCDLAVVTHINDLTNSRPMSLATTLLRYIGTTRLKTPEHIPICHEMYYPYFDTQ